MYEFRYDIANSGPTPQHPLRCGCDVCGGGGMRLFRRIDLLRARLWWVHDINCKVSTDTDTGEVTIRVSHNPCIYTTFGAEVVECSLSYTAVAHKWTEGDFLAQVEQHILANLKGGARQD